MMGNKSFVFRFADVEVREREFSLLKAGKVLAVEPKAFRVLLLLLRRSTVGNPFDGESPEQKEEERDRSTRAPHNRTFVRFD